MTIARSKKINLSQTSYYHIVSRCVRRTFLCGQDKETGKDYSHRKQWLVERLKLLSQIFSIKIAAYAIMSNHYHLVLHVNEREVQSWSHDEVVKRAAQLFPTKAKELQQKIKYLPNHPSIIETIEEWRHRLFDISWFMKSINQPIARISNIEDNCTGHFWESRFKSQALLDEGAILSAMVYVDLNPIRAGQSTQPEESDFTSIQERLISYAESNKQSCRQSNNQPIALIHFKSQDTYHKNTTPFINFNLEDYFRLVDETGRLLHPDKKGSISNELIPILERLDINTNRWLTVATTLESQYAYIIGQANTMKNFSQYKKGPKGTCLAKQNYLSNIA